MIKILERNNIIILAFIKSLIIGLFFEPKLYPDSQGYIDFTPERSVGYPLFIMILNKNLKLVIFFQLFLSIISSYFFSKKIKDFFKFNNSVFYFFFFVLLLIGIKIGVNILTGSLCFSCYLFSLYFLIKSLDKDESKSLLFSSILIFFAVLIRPQLIFATAHLIAISIYLIFKLKSKLLPFLVMLISISTFIIPAKINKTSNKYFNNTEIILVDFWNQLNILLLYTSTNILEKYFEDTNTKKVFIDSLDCVEKKKLTKFKVIENNQNWIYVLESNSFPVKNCINTTIKKNFSSMTLDEQEQLSKNFFFELFKAQIQHDKYELLMNYINKYSFAFVNLYYFFIFIIFSLILFFYQIFQSDKRLKFFNVIILSHYVNIFIIGLGAPLLLRYRFYTETIIIILILCIILEFFFYSKIKKKSFNNNKLKS